MKIAIIDTTHFINKSLSNVEFTIGYITDAILLEIKSKDALEYYEFYKSRITIRNPNSYYINEVLKFIKNNKSLENNTNSILSKVSNTDISFIALAHEIYNESLSEWTSKDFIKILCLTNDMEIIRICDMLGIPQETHFKHFIYRCYLCFTIYKTARDFCVCGYTTITRVNCTWNGNKLKLFLKKGFIVRPKILIGKNGKEIKSADQPEYLRLKREQKSKINKSIY